MFCGCNPEPFNILKELKKLGISIALSWIKTKLYSCIGQWIPILREWLDPYKHYIKTLRTALGLFQKLLNIIQAGSTCPKRKLQKHNGLIDMISKTVRKLD